MSRNRGLREGGIARRAQVFVVKDEEALQEIVHDVLVRTVLKDRVITDRLFSRPTMV
jgi:hypothetical protein